MLVREGLARLGYVPFELLGEIGGHELIKGVEIPPTDRSGDPMRDGLVLFRRHNTSPPWLLGTEMLYAESIIF